MPIPYPSGAGNVLVKVETVRPRGTDLILYADGTLIYRVGSDLLLHGKLDETATQEILRRAVDKARFFTSRRGYGGSGFDTPLTQVTVQTNEQCHSSQFNRLRSYIMRRMPPEDLVQAGRLTEFVQWLRRLDLRQVDRPGWVDLGEYIPEVISLFVNGPDSSEVASDVEAWPFQDVDLVSLTATKRNSVAELENDRAHEVYKLLTGSLSVFSQDGKVFHVRYRPNLPHEDRWPANSCGSGTR